MLTSMTANSQFCSGFSDADCELIEKALEIVAPYKDQKTVRPKGYDVASILLKFNVDPQTVLGALLSEPLYRDQIDYDAVARRFGAVVANLVKDVNWLNTLNVYTLEMTNQPNQAETLRRMLLSMTHDVRAVLIKLAYRLQRLKLLAKEDYDIRRFVARETLDIYAPIANRLGIGQLKWELEDMAFRYLDPQTYLHIAKSLAENRKQRENCINGFIGLLNSTLANEHIEAEIYGRPKHIYSIWKKMQRKKLGVDELYDLLAVRVIVNKLASCYAVLGIVHGQWQYIPKEFDDYIANPKENGYQSLHTVVLDPQGKRIEVQIRTREMHEFAELGVAAHWRYKEGGKQDSAADKSIASLRQLLEDKDSNETLLDDFRSELFADRVYTLTPGGKLIDLIKGATPLDFAYAVHSEVGHRCRGAKVNGRIVPLTYTLKSGEQVEILTAKDGKPNRNWIDPNLGYLKTSRAISKVKAWFRQQKQEQNEAAGKQILAREIQRLGSETPDLEELARHFNYTSPEKLLAAIGRGDIGTQQLAAFLKIPDTPEVFEPAKVVTKGKPQPQKSTISVQGIDNVLTSIAQCCSPVPGDAIIGFISHSKGVTIHRRDCRNIEQLNPQQQMRLVEVNWGRQEPRLAVPIVIQAYDRQGLLSDVTRLLDHAKINILDARFHSNDDLSATLELVIQVSNTAQLSQVLGSISQLSNIYDVRRKS